MARIELSNICKSYGDIDVLHDVDLTIEEGEFVVLVGPSGCGKSTLLRMIAGLEPITSGELTIDGAFMNEVRPRDRDIAMVFQSYALYPHMSVARNMGFGLELRGSPKELREARVREAAEILGLVPYLERQPRALSGGQRQRVAMGRAIVRDPKAFLFDEPLSNLDAALRVEMRLEIAKLHQRLSATMIYVTHDQVEALTLADRIVVMNDGYIQQIGTPMELYEQPANLFVARFIGSPTMNVLDLDRLPGAAAEALIPPALRDRVVRLGVRPEHSFLASGGKAHLHGHVEVIERLGSDMNIYVDAESAGSFLVRQNGNANLAAGSTIDIGFEREHLHFFDAQGDTIR